MSYNAELIARLEKCGCCDELIDHIKHNAESDAEILTILKHYQLSQQKYIDEACREIDCIDYLIYEISKG